MILDKNSIEDFQQLVLQKGTELYRSMPWREDCNPYYILLSEIMLQQTQVPRVLIKFQEFIEAFPSIESLANADLQQVLHCWTGLGYNRRARYLHDACRQIVELGEFPKDYSQLLALPGIGPNTSASILVYAWNMPLVFIETNIRTVYIYTFFSDSTDKIDEKTMHSLVQQTLYVQNPRQWYWALMDYGSYLKKTEGNYNRRSTMHTTQSKFEGSNRQKRAQILRLLLQHGPHTIESIAMQFSVEQEFANVLVNTLIKDGLVLQQGNSYCIA